jgi:hypothetical protein
MLVMALAKHQNNAQHIHFACLGFYEKVNELWILTNILSFLLQSCSSNRYISVFHHFFHQSSAQ